MPEPTLTALAEQVVDAVLAIATDEPPVDEVTALAVPETVPEPAIRKVCQMAAARTWRTLIKEADIDATGQLLRRAYKIFSVPQRIADAAMVSREAVASPTRVALRSLIAQAVVAGDGAAELVRRAGMELAPAYVVAVLDRGHASAERPLEAWPALERPGEVLATVQPDDDLLILLLPATVAPSRAETAARVRATLAAAAGNRRLPPFRVAAAPADEVPTAVDEARSVMRVIRALDYPPDVYQLDDVPVEVLLLRAPDMARLMARRIAPLLESETPLVETLSVYLGTGFDRRRASAALHVHLNTLDYRMRRIWELTGLSPRSPRQMQLLTSALMAWRIGGSGDAIDARVPY